MRTDFSEAIKVQPLFANFINLLRAKPEADESVGVPEEYIEQKAMELRHATEEYIKQKTTEAGQATQTMQVIINMPSSIWGTVVNFSSLAAENILLRRKIEQIKQRLTELVRRMTEEKVSVLREISREQAKQEIQQLFSSGRTLYYSNIAGELRLGLQLVVGICRELEKNGEVKVDENAL